MGGGSVQTDTGLTLKAASVVVERLDREFGQSWRFNLFRTNKYLAQMVNEGVLDSDFVVEHYGAITRHIQNVANQRKVAANT